MKIKLWLSCILYLLALQSLSQQSDTQWEWLNPKPAAYLNSRVYFSDANNGFIFNDNGDLIRTTDGGELAHPTTAGKPSAVRTVPLILPLFSLARAGSHTSPTAKRKHILRNTNIILQTFAAKQLIG
jgi:hypothetical protein